jgi:hypothetical protein
MKMAIQELLQGFLSLIWPPLTPQLQLALNSGLSTLHEGAEKLIDERMLSRSTRFYEFQTSDALKESISSQTSTFKLQTYYDAVIIDDDALMHMIWKMSVAEKPDKKLLTFTTANEFFSMANSIDLRSPIFIDVELGNGVRGEDVAQRVHALGFTKILLSTGHNPEDIVKPKCVLKIVGKEPILI